jgi:hypothetical protein
VQDKRRKILVAVALLIWAIGTYWSGKLFIQSLIESKNLIEAVAQLETYNGSVAYRSPDSILWNSTSSDQRFADGDIVSTANRSSAKIQTESGHVIELQANTMIKLTKANTAGDVRDNRSVLKLIQGSILAKANGKSTRLDIDAGDKTFRLSDADGVLGLAKADGKKSALVFQSIGTNEIVDGNLSSLVEPMPEKDTGVLSALRLASIPAKPESLPTLAFDLVMSTAPISLPDLNLTMPKPKIAKKIVLPKKDIATLPIKIDYPKAIAEQPEAPAKKTYPKPRLTGKLTQTVVTFNTLRTGCTLGEFVIPYSIVKDANDTEGDGWKPFLEVTYEGSKDVETMELEKSPGQYVVKISLDRVCSESSTAMQSKTISLLTGYTLADGSTRRSRFKPTRVIVKTLVGYRRHINLVFSNEPRLRPKTQNWLALDKSDARLGSETTVSITPASNQPALMRMLPYQRLVGITFSNQMDDKAGVYLVKKSDVLLGFTGTIPPNNRLEATAARIGADHGFVGYPHYLKDLRGAPVNKLSLLETIAKKTGPVTVIARGTVFDMTEEDFQKGAKELLWMTSTLSAVYSKKPDRIFFPKAGDY